MTLRVSGKNIDIGEALRSQVEARVASVVSKYFDGGHAGHVTVAKEGTGFRTECVLHLASGITLRRYKRRLKDRQAANGAANGAPQDMSAYVLEPPGDEEDEGASDFHPVIVAETTKPLHVMSVSDAVIELDLTGAPVVVFRHAGSGRLNVVYRRHDGTIGWVDPPADGTADKA